MIGGAIIFNRRSGDAFSTPESTIPTSVFPNADGSKRRRGNPPASSNTQLIQRSLKWLLFVGTLPTITFMLRFLPSGRNLHEVRMQPNFDDLKGLLRPPVLTCPECDEVEAYFASRGISTHNLSQTEFRQLLSRLQREYADLVRQSQPHLPIRRMTGPLKKVLADELGSAKKNLDAILQQPMFENRIDPNLSAITLSEEDTQRLAFSIRTLDTLTGQLKQLEDFALDIHPQDQQLAASVVRQISRLASQRAQSHLLARHQTKVDAWELIHQSAWELTVNLMPSVRKMAAQANHNWQALDQAIDMPNATIVQPDTALAPRVGCPPGMRPLVWKLMTDEERLLITSRQWIGIHRTRDIVGPQALPQEIQHAYGLTEAQYQQLNKKQRFEVDQLLPPAGNHIRGLGLIGRFSNGVQLSRASLLEGAARELNLSISELRRFIERVRSAGIDPSEEGIKALLDPDSSMRSADVKGRRPISERRFWYQKLEAALDAAMQASSFNVSPKSSKPVASDSEISESSKPARWKRGVVAA